MGKLLFSLEKMESLERTESLVEPVILELAANLETEEPMVILAPQEAMESRVPTLDTVPVLPGITEHKNKALNDDESVCLS